MKIFIGRLHWQIFALFTIVLFTYACKIKIDGYTQPEGRSYLTIDGELTNQKGPYSVKLTMSSKDITSASIFLPVQKAKVYITDQKGTKITYVEGKLGVYTTPIDFQAQKGFTYVLHIETADGKIYESNQETISNNMPKMDKVYFEDGQITVDFKDAETPNEYYQWTWKHYEKVNICQTCEGGTWSNFYNQCVRGNNPAVVYKYQCSTPCWDFYSGTSLNLFSDRFYNGKQITGLPIAKISAYKDYYLQLDTYFISQGYFEYLRALKIQTEEKGNLFDVPLLTKFNYNIHCITDPTENVLGIFKVYTSTRLITYIQGVGNYSQFVDPRAVEEDFPVSAPCVESNTRTKVMPEGWK
jgi:uncharacterized protein YneR